VAVAWWAWVGVLGVILVVLAVDLLAHRGERAVGVRGAAVWSGVWVALGVAFGAVVWWGWGGEAAGQYYAGYLIEKSLAVDNVFVFAVIFGYFAVPRERQHRVLFYGVIGALVFRAVFIAAGSALIASFSWVLYLFGAFLVLTGARLAWRRKKPARPGDNLVLRVSRRLLPKRWMARPLLAVLITIEVTDLVFSVDSIPAIFAVTQQPFLVFTSNAFAVLGLRAMYFLLADLVHRFAYLTLGLSAVLVWVGLKMLLHHAYVIPTGVSLAVVAAILAVAVGASWLRGRRSPAAGRPPGRASG
jgi:tellurite resistance protein TerC